MSTAVPGPLRWSQRSGPERFEAMTRWSIYAVFALEPFVGVMLLVGAGSGIGPGPVVMLVLLTVHAVLAARVFMPATRAYSGRGAMPWPRVRLLLVATVVAWAVMLAWYPTAGSDLAGLSLLVPATAALGALTALPRRLWVLLAAAVAVVALACGLLAAAGGTRPLLVATAVGGVLALVGCVLSFRLSAWTMRVVWELDDARAVEGRLAVAEERLRFSRDLHDVFGRTLSTVAVKSELAAALAERGDPRGPAEMLEVRQLAHDALREVRGVVQGYRSADLDTEIAGARELLRSAGVECRVAGEGSSLHDRVAEPAAWVVREAVTNVVRHAAATRCDIEVRPDDGPGAGTGGAVVRVTNDGVAPGADPGSGGNGLRGLRERLTERGGSLTAGADGGRFVVEARIPAPRAGQDLS